MKPIRLFIVAMLVAALSTPCGRTDEASQTKAAAEPATTDKVKEGHSLHGEVFNEGPRQKAFLIEGTGRVHFPVTTQNPEVQKFIDQGVGQVHGFSALRAAHASADNLLRSDQLTA